MMDDATRAIEFMRLGLGGCLVAVGLALVLVGAIGLLRFPDFYTRLHAAGVSDAAGGVLVIAGLAVAAWDLGLTLRLALLAGLMLALAPTIAHFIAHAAHAAGLAPLAGPYAAPRPGTKRSAEP